MGGTMKKALGYGAGLIALYLAVSYSTGFSRGVSSASSGSASVIKAFQGR
ncbi:hypothetical protein [Streptomyces zaomyceticus]